MPLVEGLKEAQNRPDNSGNRRRRKWCLFYRSKLNAKINRNFEVFTPTDFLAAITQQIPDEGAQMVRYYGWYSNKMRGVRQRGPPAELVFRRPGASPPPPVKLPSKRWRDLS